MSSAKELFKEAEQLKREGKNEEAIAKFEEVLKLDEKHVLTHLSLAVLYGKVEKHDLAVTHAERAAELEPEDTFNWKFPSLLVLVELLFPFSITVAPSSGFPVASVTLPTTEKV